MGRFLRRSVRLAGLRRDEKSSKDGEREELPNCTLAFGVEKKADTARYAEPTAGCAVLSSSEALTPHARH